MDFKEATDVLWGTQPVTAADMAERLGKDPHTIRRARMSGPNARSAPKGWEAVVADLAEKHADELERRVRHLRRLSSAVQQVKHSRQSNRRHFRRASAAHRLTSRIGGHWGFGRASCEQVVVGCAR